VKHLSSHEILYLYLDKKSMNKAYRQTNDKYYEVGFADFYTSGPKYHKYHAHNLAKGQVTERISNYSSQK